MSDEVISFRFEFTGQDAFTAAMQQMAAAAEQMAAKANAAFAGIKGPQAAQAGQAAQNPFQQHAKHAEEAKNKIGEFSEMIGGYAARIGSQFGESGKLLGEFSEKALLGFGAIGGALGGIERTAASAESQIVKLGKATGSHELRSEGFGVGGIAGLARFLTNPATALIGVGVAGVGLTTYAGEQAEQMEKMAQASHQTLEEFRGMQAAGQQSAIGTEAMAHAVENVREGVRQGALGARQMAEQFSLLSERAEYFRDRISQMAVMRQESAHQAADENERISHSIVEAERKLQEAQEAYSRHGKPLTETEQRDKAEKDRKRAVEDAERNLAELQHQQQDQQRRQAEQQQQQRIAEERAVSMQRREQEQLTLARRRATEEAPPIQRAFLQYAQQVEGIKDFNKALAESANMLDKVKNKSSLEQFGDVLKVFDSLRKSGVDITRGLDEAFGDQAAKIRNHMDELVAAINKGPKALKELADSFGILPTEGIEGLVKYQESIDKTLMAIKNLALKGGLEFHGLIEVVQGLSSVFELLLIPINAAISALEKLHEVAKNFISPEGTGVAKLGIVPGQHPADGTSGAEKAAEHAGKGMDKAATSAEKLSSSLDKATASVNKAGQEAETTQRVPRYGGGGTSDIRVIRPDVQHQNDYVVGHDYMTGHDILASGERRVVGPRTPSDNVRTNPFFHGATQDQDGPAAKAASSLENLSTAAERVKSAFDQLATPAKRINDAFKDVSGGGSGHQHGGLISGPGTGTSDSILARVSSGEYVVRAAAVNRLGRDFMDRINAGFADGGIIDRFATVPRYQFGGEVGRSTAALHPVTIALPSGEKISGFHGTADAVAALSKASVLAQASSTGRKPSWVR